MIIVYVFFGILAVSVGGLIGTKLFINKYAHKFIYNTIMNVSGFGVIIIMLSLVLFGIHCMVNSGDTYSYRVVKAQLKEGASRVDLMDKIVMWNDYIDRQKALCSNKLYGVLGNEEVANLEKL